MKIHFNRQYLISFILLSLVNLACLGQNSSINGYLYHDANNNCVKEASEAGINNRLLTLTPGPHYTYSQSDGSYSFEVDAGGVYTISVQSMENQYDYWLASCAGDDIFVPVSPNQDSFNQNFAFEPIIECPTLEVQASIDPLVPCESNLLILSYENTGTITAQNVVLYFSLGNNLILTESTAAVSDDDLENIGTFNPSDTVEIEMNSDIDPIEPFPNSSSLGGSFQNSINLGEVSVGASGQVFVELTVACDAIPNSTSYIQTNILHNEPNAPYCGDLTSPTTDFFDLPITTVTCLGDSIELTISNSGNDMDSIGTIGVYEDDLMGYLHDYYLLAGEIVKIKFPTTGQTYTISNEYSSDHHFPIMSIEGCAIEGENISYGYINSFPHNDSQPYKDILCLEIQETAPINQKTVHPTGITDAHYVYSNERLTYTIYFQNTLDNPSPLSISDALSPSLNINSLQVYGGSHPFEFSILENQTLVWEIIPMLESGESGHITFGIEIKGDSPDFTQILNSAELSFGSEVFTSNTTMLTVCNECMFPKVPRSVELKAFLEGPYNNNGTMDTYLGSLIPLSQPFNAPPYHYYGTEVLEHIPSEMVDWVLVEARYGNLSPSNKRLSLTAETKAALLFSDGTIRSLDGSLGLTFDNLVEGKEYSFCIRHRNHLDVVSSSSLTSADLMTFDFTEEVSKAFGFSQMKNALDGKAVLFGAEFNADGVIQATDYDFWTLLPAATNIYENTDANLDGVIQATDYDVWFLNKAKVGSVEIRF